VIDLAVDERLRFEFFINFSEGTVSFISNEEGKMNHENSANKRLMSRRELLRLAGLGAAGAVLAGCVPVAPPAAAPAEKQEQSSTQQEAAPAGPEAGSVEGFISQMAPPAEKVTLLYWWGNNYEPALQFTNEVIAQFSEVYPTVEVDPVAGQNCDAFVTAAAAGTPPDLFHTWDCVERMGNWAKRGMIIPIDDYIAASQFDLDDYFPGIMDTCRMEGKTWGMVDSAGVFLLWTRPQHFLEIGKTLADTPKDTDELWAWGDQLTTRDSSGNVERLGMRLPNWTWLYFTWIVNFGGELWDSVAGQPTPDHPGVLEALNDLLAQVNKYGADTLNRWSSSIGSQEGAQSPWLAGNATMQIEGDWSGQAIFDFFPEWKFGEDYGAIAPPPPPAAKQHGESAVAWWSWPWVIPGGTKNPDWSWELLRYYLSGAYQVPVRAKFKEMLVRKSMIDDEAINWPAAQVAREIVKGGRKLTTVMPMNPVAAEYSNLLSEAFDAIVNLAETPEAAMARVKEETVAKLQEG
jgi:ABC-type glycerol-3-phosphate transport system substrate-binding protein